MPRKPDFRLKILNTKANTRCNDAGAAWKNPNGSITLVLTPGIQLKEDKNLLYTLFEINKE